MITRTLQFNVTLILFLNGAKLINIPTITYYNVMIRDIVYPVISQNLSKFSTERMTVLLYSSLFAHWLHSRPKLQHAFA